MSSNISVFPQDNDFFSRLNNDGYLDNRYDDAEWEDENLQYDMAVYSHAYHGDFRATPVNPAIVIVVLAVMIGIVLVGVASRLEYGSSEATPMVEEVSVETAVSLPSLKPNKQMSPSAPMRSPLPRPIPIMPSPRAYMARLMATWRLT